MNKVKTHVFKWLGGYIILLIIIAISVGLHYVKRSMAYEAVADEGILQVATWILLLISCVFCLLQVFIQKANKVKWAVGSFVLLIYAMREMDLHRAFTQEHVSKLKFYLGPYPWQEKVIAGIIMILTGLALLYLVVSSLIDFWKGLKKRTPWTFYIFLWAICLFGAQILDKSRWNELFTEIVIEESMEFGAALIIFVIIWQVACSCCCKKKLEVNQEYPMA